MWMWWLGIIGMIYLGLQGFQVITMRMAGVTAGLIDIGMSSLPFIVIIFAMGKTVATGELHGDWKEWVLYSFPVIIDLTIMLAFSLIKFQLTSDVTVTK